MKRRKPPSGKVGFGKPPRHAQFKKGESGNPSGRPKRTPASPVDRALERPVYMTINGKRRRVSAWEALLNQIVEQGLRGDSASRKDAIKLGMQMESIRQRAVGAPATPPPPLRRGLPVFKIVTYPGETLRALGITREIRNDPRIQDWVVEAALERLGREEIARRELWRFADELEDPSILERYRPDSL